MNKNTFYIAIIILLLLSNLFLIGFLITHKPKGNRQRSPKEFVIEKLRFDKNQIGQYDQLIQQHQEIIHSKDKQIIQAKRDLYKLLNSKNDDKAVDSLTTAIAKLQKEIEIVHYKHFLDIKALCREDQKGKFETLTKEIEHLFSMKKGDRPLPED